MSIIPVTVIYQSVLKFGMYFHYSKRRCVWFGHDSHFNLVFFKLVYFAIFRHHTFITKITVDVL